MRAWERWMISRTKPTPALATPALTLAAHVAEVHEGGGFQASVFIGRDRTGLTPVVRLDASIRGSRLEGRVFRWALGRLIEGSPGYFEYVAASGVPLNH